MIGSGLIVLVALLAGQADQDRSASVSGRVVDAVSGRPIPGVVVTPAGSAVVPTAASPLPPRALTNGAGEFVLRGLRKGAVFLTAVKAGHITATYNQRRPAGAGQNLPVVEGQQLSGVVIRMWRHASITGTVVDEAGDPAIAVRVVALRRRYVAGRRIFTATATAATDDRGMYRLANLAPGDYAVGVPATQTAVPTEVMDVFFGPNAGGSSPQRSTVSRELNEIKSAIVPVGSQYAIGVGDQTFTLPPGTLLPQATAEGGLLIYPTVFYPAAGSVAQASAISVQSGEERSSIDLQMHPVRSARVSGTVIAPDGPAAYVGVRLIPAAADDAAQAIEVATTMTDANGGFTFAAVPAGQHVLTVLRPPAPPVDLHETGIRVTPGGEITMSSAVAPANPPPQPVPADATLFARVPLSVSDSVVSGLVVPLAAAPRVSGRIEFEGTGDRPASGDIARIRINLDPADGARLANEGLNFEAGHPEEDRQFRTLGVPPGRYVLRANPPAGWYLKTASAGGADLSDVPFELTGKDLTGLVITFTDRPAALTGVVRNGQAGDPDALVLAFPTDSSAWRSRGAYPRRLRVGRTAQDGTFTIDGLPPGEYHVVAIHEDAIADDQDPALFAALARLARQVRIGEGERRTEDLTPVVIR